MYVHKLLLALHVQVTKNTSINGLMEPNHIITRAKQKNQIEKPRLCLKRFRPLKDLCNVMHFNAGFHNM